MAVGGSGKTYSKDASGSITVTRPDGSKSTVSPGSSNYNSTVNAMHSDGVKNIGVSSGSSSTPSYTSPGTSNNSPNYSSGGGNYIVPVNPNLTPGSGASSSGSYSPIGVGGGSGKYYTKTQDGTITVRYPDGSSKTVSPGTPGYAATNTAMQQDAGSNSPTYSQIQQSPTPAPVNPYQALIDEYNAKNLALSQQQMDFDAMLQQMLQGGGAFGDQQAMIQQAQQQSAEAIRQQTEASIGSIEQGKDKITGSYEEAARQAYIQSQIGKNNMNETMANSGINGGATESAILGIENQYQQALSGIDKDKNDALNKIQSDIAMVRASGNAQLAQTMSDYYMKLADAAINADNEHYNRLMQALNLQMQQAQITGSYRGTPTLQAQQMAYEQAMGQQSYNDDRANTEYQKQQQAYQNAINEIQTFGKIISPSLISALGGQTIANQMAQQYQIQNAPQAKVASSSSRARSSSGSSRGSSSAGTFSGSGAGTFSTASTPTPQQTLSAVSGLKSTQNDMNFMQQNGAFNNMTPTKLIEDYKAGKYTYEQVKTILSSYGWTPEQFGITKGR